MGKLVLPHEASSIDEDVPEARYDFPRACLKAVMPGAGDQAVTGEPGCYRPRPSPASIGRGHRPCRGAPMPLSGRGPKAPGRRPPRLWRALLARRVGRWPLPGMADAVAGDCGATSGGDAVRRPVPLGLGGGARVKRGPPAVQPRAAAKAEE